MTTTDAAYADTGTSRQRSARLPRSADSIRRDTLGSSLFSCLQRQCLTNVRRRAGRHGYSLVPASSGLRFDDWLTLSGGALFAVLDLWRGHAV